jgi:NAD(P)-dependent dehydrogenase (short-subunit alcohol dehydrogenase family)
MLARDGDRLHRLARDVPGASAYVCDVADEATVTATIAKITETLGPPSVLIHNAVAGAGVLDIDPAGWSTTSASIRWACSFGRAVA